MGKKGFDWYAKKLEIKNQSYRPRKPRWDWVWEAIVILIACAIAFSYLHTTVVAPFLELKVQEAEASYMTDEEICANLDRFINGEEFEEYCQTNYGV